MFSTEIIEAFKQHACSEYPKEACGFITTKGYEPQINISEDPTQSFEIDKASYLEASDRLLAVVHSHPDGNYYPSIADMQSQIATNVPWGLTVVGCDPFDGSCKAQDVCWWGDGVDIPDLEGRIFHHGITDCYSLIRHYFMLEQNITLDEFPRSWEWWESGKDLYSDNFKSQGFIEIPESEVKTGDCFLASIRSKVINHAGVYVGNDLILHQLGSAPYSPSNRSIKEPVHRLRRSITKWVRYAGN